MSKMFGQFFLCIMGLVAATPSGAGLFYNDSICDVFKGEVKPMTKGDYIPVCIVISNDTHSFKTVFYPKVDEFTLLEIDNSWSMNNDWYGHQLGASMASFQMHIEINGSRSDYIAIQGNNYQIPYWTITAWLDEGKLNTGTPFVWDNDGGTGCFGGCADSECLDGFCGVEVDSCGTADDDNDCDCKVYLGFYGTDSAGNYMSSASKRLSAFRSWSLVAVFESAKTMAAENHPDPDALVDTATDPVGAL